MRMRPCFVSSFLAVTCLVTPLHASFVNFESQHVHPIAMSADGTQLYAVNTPDNRLAVFDITGGGLSLAFEVPVGLDPVSVAVENDTRVWVANLVSDTVSIVDLRSRNVVKTLHVGDEPTSVVFAGPSRERAFVCVSQEDAVKIYNTTDLGAAPVVVPIFGSDPQALAVSSDGLSVYAAAFESGNQTTVAGEQDVLTHGGLPEPNPEGRPDTGLILKWNGTDWVDEDGTSYTDTHPYTLPDHDVAVLDATVSVPVPTYVDHLGTLLYNIGVHPVSGYLYVPNTDALNHIRFEPNLRGQFARTRVAIVDPANPTSPSNVDVNPHIDYTTTPGPPSEIALSLSQPGDLAFASGGGTIYMTALGSAKVAVLDDLGNVTDRIELVGEGPSGLALDEANARLYVMNRFTNTIDVVDIGPRTVIETVSLFDPSPDAVRSGRRFLYDARVSSGHGDLACSSCHAGGNFDGIAWDLGDPNGTPQPPPPDQIDPLLGDFHPMKGPMTTQTLRGLAGTQPFHWRGDREDFEDFNPAFISLMGLDTELPSGDMQAFKDFVFTIQYAPNPTQNLDRSFPNPATGPSPEVGRQLFSEIRPLDGPFFCSDCHALPTGTNGQLINRFALQESQDMKTPQLRNMYEKTGFSHLPGEQKRGYGFIHDGSLPTLFDFLQFGGFSFANDDERRHMEAFLLAFDTGTAPAVGVQYTVHAANKNAPETSDWLTTMTARVAAGDCDLVAKGLVGGFQRGWVYDDVAGLYRSDHTTEPLLSQSALLDLAANSDALTFTGVPPGCGTRIGIDRDEDGWPDRTEIGAGTDPTDPASFPAVTAVGPGPDGAPGGADRITTFPNPADAKSGATLAFDLGVRQHVRVRVYDAGGRYVATPLDAAAGPGRVRVHWNGADSHGRRVASGMYFYRLDDAAGLTHTRSLLLLR